MGIAAELVEALEQCVNGKIIAPDYLQSICSRLVLFGSPTEETLKVIDSCSFWKSPVGNERLISHPVRQPQLPMSTSQGQPIQPLNYAMIKRNLLGLTDRYELTCLPLQPPAQRPALY